MTGDPRQRAPQSLLGRQSQRLIGKVKSVARRALTGVDEREELWSALFACAWEQLVTYPLERRPRRVAANVVLDTLHQTLRTMREMRGVGRPVGWEPRDDGPDLPPEESADIEVLLERAVAQGAISDAEADLVLAHASTASRWRTSRPRRASRTTA